jgi:regulator of replication initiation timing
MRNVNGQTARLESDALRLQQDNARLKEKVTHLEWSRTDLQRNVSGLLRDNAGLKQDNEGLRRSTAGLEQRFSTVERENVGLRQESDHFRQAFAALEARMERLEGTRADKPGAADSPAPHESADGTEPARPDSDDQSLSIAEDEAKKVRLESDRPGWWSNAKTALYGAAGSGATVVGAAEFAPHASPIVVNTVASGITVMSALVPTVREGWRKRKHGD